MTGFLLPPEAEPAPAWACGSAASKVAAETVLIRSLVLIALAGLLTACGGSSSSHTGKSSGNTPTHNGPGLLSTSSTLVEAGDNVTLSWNAGNATGCIASGGWSGSRGQTGSEVVGPITGQTTFTLSCTESGNTIVDMVAISITGTISLSWIAPTANVDGSQLTDLAGYRIYYGQISRDYTDIVAISDPTATSIDIALPSGDYYVAMTALDREDNESAYSNEVLKSVR